MSFDIYVAGTGNFSYSRNRCEDGSSFDVINIISILQSLDCRSKAHLGLSGVAGYTSNKTPGIVEMMLAAGNIAFLDLLSSAVGILAGANGKADGWIAVNAFQKNILFPDVSRSAIYRFTPGISPSAEFIEKIKDCLIDTELTKFGVLIQLQVAITKYANSISSTETTKLTINLTC